jgi:hypothetical protein
LAYLSDIFSHFNDLNISLQGREKNILIMSDKVNAFIKKLGIWIIRLEKRKFDAFDLTSNYIEKNVILKSPILDRVLDTMKTHLRELKIQLLEYFSFNDNDFSNIWVLNPLIHLMKILLQLPNYQLRLTTN